MAKPRWHRLVEWFLPWFDPAVEAEREAHSEAVRTRAIRARIITEKVRKDYAEMDARLRGKA